MDSSNRLQTFVRELFEMNNAVVESPRDDILEVLLPANIYKNTPFNEYEKFYFDGEKAGDKGKLISFHTDVFDSFYQMLDGRGYAGLVELPKGYLKSSGFEQAVEERLVFTNGIFHFQKREEKKVSYLFVNFLYTAVSEDKKEGIVQQAVNEYTMAGIDWPCPLSEIETESPPIKSIITHSIKRPGGHDQIELPLWKTNEKTSPKNKFLQDNIIKKSLQRASLIVQNKVRGLLVDFEKKLNHHLNRDIKRLNDYYGTIESEIRKKIVKKNLTGPEKEKELSRIEATRKELGRKVNDQKDRYKMKIELQPINVLRVEATVNVLSLTLHRKKQSREVDFVWNPFLKQVEPLSCESCFVPITVLTFCDDSVHIICRNCATCRRCGKLNCRVCSQKKCRRCGKNPSGIAATKSYP